MDFAAPVSNKHLNKLRASNLKKRNYLTSNCLNEGLTIPEVKARRHEGSEHHPLSLIRSLKEANNLFTDS